MPSTTSVVYCGLPLAWARSMYLSGIGSQRLICPSKNFSSFPTSTILKPFCTRYTYEIGDYDLLGNPCEYRGNVLQFIYCADKITKRTYETDALGRVTKVTDGTDVKHSYKYNYRGFLEEADGERYAYDGNGNITQLGTTVLAYDSKIKDKLISVGGFKVSYVNKSSLNPTGWKDRLYEYEGGRLVKFTIGNDCHEYTYNDQGQRIIKRKHNGETTKYYYAGDKLITEINPTYRLDFLYDENGQLYGLIRDNASKFFYVKDFLSNILGIVNEDGKLVTKYDYTGFGKCKTILSSDNISLQNPFRFKGYYLDSESGMYYCHTRYYVPEWGRWLNADHPDFLKFDNLSNVNLFSYCGNNPVMNVDPSGNFWDYVIDAFFLAWSITDVINNPKDWENWAALGVDLVFAVLPFIPSGGGKVITKADDIVDVAGFVNKYDEVIVLGQTMKTRVIPYADEIGATCYKGLDNFKDIEKSIGTVGASFAGYFHNMGYIALHTFSGARFIDKGFDAARTLKGLKGMNLFLEIMSIVTIYSEKFFAQLLRKKNVFRFFGHWLF